METCPTFQAYQCRSASSSRHCPSRWMECDSGTHSRRFPPRQGGDFHGERERSEGVVRRNSLQWVLGSACANQCQRERHRNLRAGTGMEWLYAEPSTLPASAWRHLRTVPEPGTIGRKCERRWNEPNRSESEQTIQYTDKQGWQAAELAPRVAVRRWLKHRPGVEVFDVRPPTRIAGREELQVVPIASSTYDGALRASRMDGVMTRPFYTTRGRRNPLPLRSTTSAFLSGRSFAENVLACRTCIWCGDDTLGTCRKSKNNRLRRGCETRAEKYTKFLGELRDVSGLPVSRGPDAVTDLLTGWKVSPVKTFRQGYRRTLVVRALEQPMSTKLQHEFGLAVIKRTAMQKARPIPEIQKWVPASDRRKPGEMQSTHRPGQ